MKMYTKNALQTSFYAIICLFLSTSSLCYGMEKIARIKQLAEQSYQLICGQPRTNNTIQFLPGIGNDMFEKEIIPKMPTQAQSRLLRLTQGHNLTLTKTITELPSYAADKRAYDLEQIFNTLPLSVREKLQENFQPNNKDKIHDPTNMALYLTRQCYRGELVAGLMMQQKQKPQFSYRESYIATIKELKKFDADFNQILLTRLIKNRATSFIIGTLVQNGADPNAIYDTATNSTLLHHAVTENNTPLLGLLLDHKACTSLQDIDGNTPLHLALQSDYGNAFLNSIIIESLLPRSSAGYALKNKNYSLQNNDGDTPLHLALKGNHYKEVKLLLAAGVDPYIENNAGENAFLCNKSWWNKPSLLYYSYPKLYRTWETMQFVFVTYILIKAVISVVKPMEKFNIAKSKAHSLLSRL